MRTATVKIKGMSSYSQSQALKSEKGKSESYHDFEDRVWVERMHLDSDDNVIIPIDCITQGMSTSASYLGKTGELAKKGQSTWAENIRCGIVLTKSPCIGKKSDAKEEWVYCHANGKRGPGTRVWRKFPMFYDWSTTMVITILDDSIPNEVFEKVIRAFGLFNGIGRHRPQNGGYHGRFDVISCEITENPT